MNEKESDLNLVKRARNKDQEAFRLLVERYQRKVFGICIGMVRNRDDAMDMVQETFIKIYRNIDRFQGNSAFYTWIYRITTNVCIDFLRKQKRQKTVDYDDTLGHNTSGDEESVLLPSRLGLNPARVLGRKELMEKLREALAGLSDNHRQVIVLREVQGLSYQEIADVADISIGTVMSRLHHARKNIQLYLSTYLKGSLEVDS